MKLLGSCIISTLEQRTLADGASLDLPRTRLEPRILARARIGDLMWAQEPYALALSRRFGPQNIREVLVGPVAGKRTIPVHIKHILHQLRQKRMAAHTLSRQDSRATLEIMGISEHAVRVQVHMQQVDAFLKARAACG